MTPEELDGFLKEAGIGQALLRAGKAIGTGLKGRAISAGQAISAGVRSTARQVAAGGVAPRTATYTVREGGKVVGEAPRVATKGLKAVRNRMLTRGAIGATVGVGHEAVSSKLQGRDFSLGKAIAKGTAGAAVGAALGTTVGRRAARRLYQPRRTPAQTLKGTIKEGPGVGILETQRRNFANMSPLEKGYLGMTAIDAGHAAFGKNEKGDRGARLGGAVGESAAMLMGARWMGTRNLSKGWKGTAGSLARQGALFGGASIAGSALGSLADRQKPPPSTVAPGATVLYDARRRRKEMREARSTS